MNQINKIILGLCLCLLSSLTFSETYLEKFQQYMVWNLNLPKTPTPEFIEFITKTTPLAEKLRNRWLYQLAHNNNWKDFLHYYQPTQDPGLQCYQQLARVNEGQVSIALPEAKALWLQSTSQPVSCNALFTWLLKTEDPNQTLITERIAIALENRNISMATYLLTLYNPAHLIDKNLLLAIHQKPTLIASLTKAPLHNDFYLYGLKQLISSNKMEQAITFWQTPKAHQLLTEKQNQSFLSFLVIYKAMRDSTDTERWFTKIKPKYYTNLLLDWEIRYALKHQQWQTVTHLIPLSQQKDEPSMQYWLARALQKQGKSMEAKAIYTTLAKTRHYYGFLASLRLKTKFQFTNEVVVNNSQRLKSYQPITDQIKTLYATHQGLLASHLINDFASELPKEDKSAFVLWVQNELKWHDKAMYLSNADDLKDQLSLRFPLAHQQDIAENAKHYQIPPELIYAVIRQESGFREDVISPAGAFGLMQIMPATAQKISKQFNINYNNKNQLFGATENIKIGTAYLQQLAKRYHHPILIAAAYNAGPTQVNFWLKNHSPKPMDIWIDTLPWKETRNYLKNIIAFYAVYQYRMNEKADLGWFMEGFK